jgi:hypothetical protein
MSIEKKTLAGTRSAGGSLTPIMTLSTAGTDG